MDWGGLKWIGLDWGGLGWIRVDWGVLGRGIQPVAGQRHTMRSASLIHLTLCSLFGFEGLITFPHSYSTGESG